MPFAYPNLPAGLNVSRETSARLDAFLQLVRKWNKAINLVAPSSLQDGWHRHIADSAQLFSFCSVERGFWLDIGSGGGFPGVVLAVIASEIRPELRFCLVESDARKSVFLREAARLLSLEIDVKTDRIETMQPAQAQIMSARALAPVSQLLDYANRHLSQTGVALLLKGRNAESELAAARTSWRFVCQSHPSQTEPEASVLEIRDLHHV